VTRAHVIIMNCLITGAFAGGILNCNFFI